MTDHVAHPAHVEDGLKLRLHDDESSAALVLAAAGAVDLLTTEQLTDAVTAALARRPAVLVIDLTAVTFLDSSGLSVLARAHADGGRGTPVRVVVVEDSLAHRAITLTGMHELLPVFTSTADALADRPR
ncbi:STAS domain-containing protein [Amycolatopsis sp. lyj-23]|uniref:STAS domain-containing protein n=1 Tax=Amycolatopsis sp. lyj-23 TaxID=2789283 RepID=UPI00397B51A7